MPSKQPFIDIPISDGTAPDWNTRLGNPLLQNMFVGDSGSVYCTPGLQPFPDNPMIKNGRAVHFTPFKGGAYIVVVNNAILRLSLTGTLSLVLRIPYSALPVQIDENDQFQVTIVDGQSAYVYDQNNNTVVKLGESNGIDPIYNSICSVVVLNTFTILLDKETRTFIVSNPNNALTYNPLYTAQISPQLTEALSLEILENNLYIFGKTGIDRWEPSLNINLYAFPFTKDNNFRDDIGAIGTAAVIRGISAIYFLSNHYVPTVLSGGTIRPLVPTGTSLKISQYSDVDNCIASFYGFRGNYFFHMTFLESDISWVYCVNSEKMSISTDLVVSSPPNIEAVLTPDGFFNLSPIISGSYARILISKRLLAYKGQQNNRSLINGIEGKIVQGYAQSKEPQFMEMALSLDSESWLNTIAAPIGRTGQRNAVTRWRTNVAANEFTVKLAYYGDLNFTIEKLTAYIK